MLIIREMAETEGGYTDLSVLSVQCFCKSKTAKTLRLPLSQDIKRTLPGTQNNSHVLTHN